MIGVGSAAVIGAASGIYLGATAVYGVYLGSTLVWRKLQAASATFPATDIGNSTPRNVASWVADGWGPATVSSTFTWGSSALQWTSFTSTMKVRVNGVEVQGLSQSRSTGGWSATITWTGTLNNGDVVAVEANVPSGNPAYAPCRTVNASSSITPS